MTPKEEHEQALAEITRARTECNLAERQVSKISEERRRAADAEIDAKLEARRARKRLADAEEDFRYAREALDAFETSEKMRKGAVA